MKKFCFILLGFFICTGYTNAQKDKEKKDVKFDKKLLCPFEKGMGRVPKEAYSWDPPDMKVIFISKEDTAIRSCIDAKVLSINPTDDGRYEMVIYYKEYYFWYYGIAKAVVNTNQNIKTGQVLGIYIKGQELEFRMYKDEEMMDPRKFLECTVVDEKKDNQGK